MSAAAPHQNRKTTETLRPNHMRHFLRWHPRKGNAACAQWHAHVAFKWTGNRNIIAFRCVDSTWNHTRSGNAISDMGIPFKSWNKIWFDLSLFSYSSLPVRVAVGTEAGSFLCELIVSRYTTSPCIGISQHRQWHALNTLFIQSYHVLCTWNSRYGGRNRVPSHFW